MWDVTGHSVRFTSALSDTRGFDGTNGKASEDKDGVFSRTVGPVAAASCDPQEEVVSTGDEGGVDKDIDGVIPGTKNRRLLS